MVTEPPCTIGVRSSGTFALCEFRNSSEALRSFRRATCPPPLSPADPPLAVRSPVPELDVTITTPSSSTRVPALLLISNRSLTFHSFCTFTGGTRNNLHASGNIPADIYCNFLGSLLSVVRMRGPRCTTITFSLTRPAFHRRTSANCGSNHPRAPRNFVRSIGGLRRLLASFNLGVCATPNFRTSSIVNALTRRNGTTNLQIGVLDNSRSLFRLVSPRRRVAILRLNGTFTGNTGGKLTRRFGTRRIGTGLSVLPSRIISCGTLYNSSSSGVPKIGKVKTGATTGLLTRFNSLSAVCTGVSGVGNTARGGLLRNGRSTCRSQFVTGVIASMSLKTSLTAYGLSKFSPSIIVPTLGGLRFRGFVDQLNGLRITFNKRTTTMATTGTNQTLRSKKGDRGSSRRGGLKTSITFFSTRRASRTRTIRTITVQPRVVAARTRLCRLLSVLSTRAGSRAPIS